MISIKTDQEIEISPYIFCPNSPLPLLKNKKILWQESYFKEYGFIENGDGR